MVVQGDVVDREIYFQELLASLPSGLGRLRKSERLIIFDIMSDIHTIIVFLFQFVYWPPTATTNGGFIWRVPSGEEMC